MSTFHPPPHLMPLHSHRLQPQSSATRDIELQYDKVDAEASSILIALANHNRKEQHASEMAAAAAMKSLAAATGQDLSCASFLAATKRPLPVLDTRIVSNGRSTNERKSISPSQDTTARPRQAKRPAPPPTIEDQPRQKMVAIEPASPTKDPILLLAAAAAAVDSKHQEDVKVRHRSVVGFERSHVTEIKSNATAADVLERAPFSTDTSNHATPLTYQQQVYDEHRPYYGEKRQHLVQPVSPPTVFSSSPPHHDPHHMVNRETSTRNPSPPPLSQPHLQPSMRSSDRSNVFSHQYLSMKQNPKIKRNAMHAYITYMIYADLSHNGGQTTAPNVKDMKNSRKITTSSGPSSTGRRSYSSTANQASAFYSAPEKDMRYAYRREEKPYSSPRGYHSYSQQQQQPAEPSSSSRQPAPPPHPYQSDGYRSQPDSERSNGAMSRMSTPSLPPLPATNSNSTGNSRSPYGSDYYSPSQQRNSSSSWSRSSVPPPSLPPLHGYGSSRTISPTLRPSILPPPSSANEGGRSSIPPPLPLPSSTRDQTSSTNSPVPNSNIFNRPLTAFLWSDGAAPARPDRILPPVSKSVNEHTRPDAYYDRP